MQFSNDDLATIRIALKEAARVGFGDARELLEKIEAGKVKDPLFVARECFLSLIADAKRFDEDCDGDEIDGRPVVTVNYDLRVNEGSLRDLVEALGINVDIIETAGDAIAYELEKGPPA